MYISGKPGTGKTASVRGIINTLGETYRKNQVTVVEINCMTARSPKAIYQRLLSELSPGTANDDVDHISIAKSEAILDKRCVRIFCIQ